MDVFSIRLKKLLAENGITMYKLAKDLQCSKQSVCNWCDGISEPKITYLRTLAVYFDVSSDYLLGLENEDGTRNSNIKHYTFNGETHNNTFN
ncbi:MAG: helix-turn-helix transcriptional regulator [Clostridiales bacterium]|nr:helix-turn-helix transcriptional regulator [Clostridiales bacterium]